MRRCSLARQVDDEWTCFDIQLCQPAGSSLQQSQGASRPGPSLSPSPASPAWTVHEEVRTFRPSLSLYRKPAAERIRVESMDPH